MLGKWIANRLPLVLPYGWALRDESEDGRHYRNESRGLGVIVSGSMEADGNRWMHFSASHKERIPTWPEFVELKELFLGRETRAIQVIPPRSEYVNINPNVLHAFVPVDHDPIPDFTKGGGTL